MVYTHVLRASHKSFLSARRMNSVSTTSFGGTAAAGSRVACLQVTSLSESSRQSDIVELLEPSIGEGLNLSLTLLQGVETPVFLPLATAYTGMVCLASSRQLLLLRLELTPFTHFATHTTLAFMTKMDLTCSHLFRG